MTYTPRRDFFVKFLQEPLPIESSLADNLHDFLNSEIVSGNIKTKQEAVEWLTWTFMFRRLAPNPNYYNLSGRAPEDLNDFLSQLIEDTVEDLVVSKCVIVDQETEMDLSPANLGRIAAFYSVKYQTIAVYAKNLEDDQFLAKKLRGLIPVLSQSAEFELPLREGEEPLLNHLSNMCEYPVQGEMSIQNKANILLQCHFDRRPLPVDLGLDLKYVLSKSLKLVHAMVDVISSGGNLGATMSCMELSQMLVQAMWPKQSALLQLPGFDEELVQDLKKEGVKEIGDFMNMEDEARDRLLSVSDTQMQQLAAMCNRYPILDIEHQVSRADSGEVTVDVSLCREDDDEESLAVFDEPLVAQFFPSKRHEEWWVVVGDSQSGKLLAIKKISNFRGTQKADVQLKFEAPNSRLQLFVICDSFMGCDLQQKLDLTAEK